MATKFILFAIAFGAHGPDQTLVESTNTVESWSPLGTKK
jgi:hypothetical protein